MRRASVRGTRRLDQRSTSRWLRKRRSARDACRIATTRVLTSSTCGYDHPVHYEEGTHRVPDEEVLAFDQFQVRKVSDDVHDHHRHTGHDDDPA